MCILKVRHQKQQDRLGERRPEIKVRRRIAGGGDHGRHLEAGMAQDLFERSVQAADIPGDDGDTAENDNHIEPQFFIEEHLFEPPQKKQIVTAEVDAE